MPWPREHLAERPLQDPQVERQRAVLDVPEVELDPLRPRQRGAAVDLGPAGDPGLDREAAALALGVLVDLGLDRRARPDDRHVAAQDVPEVRQLVERVAAQDRAGARDARVARGDGQARAGELGAVRPSCAACRSKQRPVLAHAGLAVDGPPRDSSLTASARTATTGAVMIASGRAMARSRARLTVIACPPPAPSPRGCRGPASPTARWRARRWSARSSGRPAAGAAAGPARPARPPAGRPGGRPPPGRPSRGR